VAASESLPRAVRRRAREEITREIVDVARHHLATDGASGLSLRAVARELGMVSSAVYRYVASRDELLTLLIIDGYDALGAAAEDAERQVPRGDLGGRWLAVCHGVRDWAVAHPHEYALLYGSPVPGYVAPGTTIGPATRVTALLTQVLADTVTEGVLTAGPDGSTADGGSPDGSGAGSGVPSGVEDWRAAMGPVRSSVPPLVPDELLFAGLLAWTHLFGAVSFELFGHRHQVIEEDLDLRRAFFGEEMARMGRFTGIPRAATS